jgi:hypothetical protein
MILFLGDSFTWGQGLYFEKWKNEGIDVPKWKEINGEVYDFPHENLDYQSHQYRRQHHFPSLVAKHYDKNYDVKWGNGGSNWDTIHQINMIPIFASQFRDGLDLIVIQLTDWTRGENRVLYNKDLYEQAIPDTRYLSRDEKWEDKLIDKIMDDEALYQIKQMEKFLKILDKRWIVVSWLEDMGQLVKENFPSQYVPIYYNGKEHTGFDVLLRDPKYCLDSQFSDGHLNSKGCKLVADSIIKKIDSIGGKTLFRYAKKTQESVI